jgi:hypothetical protein
MSAEPAARENHAPPFYGVLFERPEDSGEPIASEPAFFSDINLDQVLELIVAGREEYGIKQFFYRRLAKPDEVYYRHEVFRDLEDEKVLEAVKAFSASMREMREYLARADKIDHKYRREAWFLDAVDIYCRAVGRLAHDLATLGVNSRALMGLRDYLSDYLESPFFVSLSTETADLVEALANVRYCLHIKGSRITVRRYSSESDYSEEILSIFEKFKEGAEKDYRVEFRDDPEMNHIEEGILDLVARLFDDVFASLDDYFTRHGEYLDGRIRKFDREIQFYLAFLDFVEQLEESELSFCLPTVSSESKEVSARDAFDLALASKLVPLGGSIVLNDFWLSGPERIFVVSGPNQGGKTTFARMFGQMHHLAGIGCPVPGREAVLFLFDEMFTHFEREEDLANLSGKLEDDIIRMKQILEEATSDSIIIVNEIFSSTTWNDALFLGTELMKKIIDLDVLCVFVTFVDELSAMGESTVSMMSTVVPENPTQRTFKIVRKPADGLAYAMAIAEKYGLTRENLKERIGK